MKGDTTSTGPLNQTLTIYFHKMSHLKAALDKQVNSPDNLAPKYRDKLK